MLAHQPLFAGTTREIMGQVMFREILAPSSVRGGVPPDVETVAMTLLARDREGRYPTAEAAIAALLGCADAPRDGRGELVQVLAERFPDVAGARAPRTAALAPAVVVGSAPGAPVASPITVNAPPSQVAVEPRPAVYFGRDFGRDFGRGLDPGLGRGLDRWQRRRFVAAIIAGCVGFVLGILAAAAVLALVIR
jgi:serine/threonine-protein kinase